MPTPDAPSDLDGDTTANGDSRSKLSDRQSSEIFDTDERRSRYARDKPPDDELPVHMPLEELRDRLLHAFDHLLWGVENQVSEFKPFGSRLEPWIKSQWSLRNLYDRYEHQASTKALEDRANRIVGTSMLRGDASEREKSLLDENVKLRSKVIGLSSDLRKVRSRFAHIDSDLDASEESESESDGDSEVEPPLDNDENETKTQKPIFESAEPLKGKVKRWKSMAARHGKVVIISDDTHGDKLPMKASKTKNVIEHFRNWDDDGVYTGSTIKIWSRPLIGLLESAIDYYPGNEIHYPSDGTITMQEPFIVLFAFRGKLEDAIANANGLAAAHGKLLMDLVMNEAMQSIALKHTEIEQRLCKEITFREMWLLYTPGQIVYSKHRDHWQAYRIEQILGDNVRSGKVKPETSGGVYFANCSFASFNNKGTELRRCASSFTLFPFAGIDIIRNLKYVPAAFMENEEDLRAKLIERGRVYWSYRGESHHKEYTGDAWPSFDDQKCMRVIIDYSTTSRSESFHSNDERDDAHSYSDQMKPISGDYRDNLEEAFLFCPSHVNAYSLKEKGWRKVALDDLQPVNFNEAAFKKLVIDKTYKQTVAAMASSHLEKTATSHDLIPGKGKSLVILLHGSPGTGKTLTAECVAEHARRPLYMVTSGDLGTSAQDLERKLRTTFEYAANWNAVLLLDEADVFLQERDVTYLDRNALVSVFLHELEYFQGLIFLTTNRPGALDEAFQSRIHITLWLPDLNQNSRIKIWALFVKELPIPMHAKQRLLGDIETNVGKVALNGRQIRNFMQAARALAQQGDEDISIKHIKDVVDIGQKFTTYMKEVNRMDLEQKALALGMRLSQSTAEKG